MTALIAGFFVVSAATASSSDHHGNYASDSAYVIGSRIAYGIAAVGTLILAIRYARTGIYVTHSQVIVRNVWKTHHIPWEEIESFAPPMGYGGLRKTGLQIHRSDGSAIGVARVSWTPDSGGDPGGRRPGWVVQRSTRPSSVVRLLPW
jgi:hypothetical protein